jgi:ribosomal protein S18 acetylase RimI-like enzyme
MLVPPIVRIRPGRTADAQGIARVYVDAWRSAYAGIIPNSVLVRMSEQAQTLQWSQQLARRSGGETVVVAELAGHGVIGFGSCGDGRHAALPQAGEIYTLYVAPEHQERGVGRAVLLQLFEALVDRGHNSAMVWVLALNPARFFYEAMGGRRIAEKRERLWNALLPQVAYGWDDLRLVRTQLSGEH